ncbi:hypothetical protein PAXRUDRAFT_160741 [Paxillus rubicundulus Ve08.2h10]|uniref:Uncharacterized protein n=1 Tax=Paxillus rubicundulus Ve08.2h10 TaxID=930991 RepID=A0A0D0DMI6_9AGAM|nr:hypothetical protein PAXRUDRAFT_160741 [Paxillus rubicundulus Ve08.2h10]
MPQEDFQPYKHQIGPPSLELCFAMRSLGHSLYTDLWYEDIVKGKEQFQCGLSLFSNEVMNKAYEAKMASNMCILNHLALMQSEIHAMEKCSDFLHVIQGEHMAELSATNKQLDWVKDVLTNYGVSHEEHIALNHTAYADEVVVLTITDMQLNQISSVFRM